MNNEDGAKKESQVSPEELRGYNTTIDLIRVIAEATKFSGLEDPSGGGNRDLRVDEKAVLTLLRKIKEIDKVVKGKLSSSRPQTQKECIDIVSTLINEEIISQEINFYEIFMYANKQRLAAQDQWNLLHALLDIDISVLVPKMTGGFGIKNTERYNDFNFINAKVIDMIKQRGLVISKIDKVEGVNAGLFITCESKIKGINVELKLSTNSETKALGYPGIMGVWLTFSPEVLVSLRDVPWNVIEPILPEDPRKAAERERKAKEEAEQKAKEQSAAEDRARTERERQDEEARRRTREDEERRRRSPSSETMSLDRSYEILGLKSGEDKPVVKSAFRNLTKKYHPDTGGATADSSKFDDVVNAYRRIQESWGIKRNI